MAPVVIKAMAAPCRNWCRLETLGSGYVKLPAHMFTFTGIVADITPPVCLAAMRARLSPRPTPMKTGFEATRLAIAAFLIPYMFIFSPAADG